MLKDSKPQISRGLAGVSHSQRQVDKAGPSLPTPAPAVWCRRPGSGVSTLRDPFQESQLFGTGSEAVGEGGRGGEERASLGGGGFLTSPPPPQMLLVLMEPALQDPAAYCKIQALKRHPSFHSASHLRSVDIWQTNHEWLMQSCSRVTTCASAFCAVTRSPPEVRLVGRRTCHVVASFCRSCAVPREVSSQASRQSLVCFKHQ